MERRLAVILAADVVGYSRLMEADEEATVRTLSTYRKIIEDLVTSHHGRVFGSAGDSTVAEFASPIEAVRCAVDIQRELEVHNVNLAEDRRMRLRIGVNLGDVMVEGDNLLGDGVNVAARLETLTDPGGISLGRSVFDQVKKQLDLGYEYLGEHEVKNIAEPVQVYRVLTEPEAVGKVIGEAKQMTQLWMKLALAAAVIVVIAVSGIGLWLRPWQATEEPASVERMAFPLPDRPSIAVLPFENLSGDTEQNYLADGLTEEIITTLAKSPNLFVIARNSTFAYKDKNVEAKQVAEEQGVRFVLEGSLQSSGERIRINIQLIDALAGRHVWAEIYDRQFGDIFALQDDITQNIMIALEVELTQGEEVRLMHSRAPNVEAFLYLQKSRVHYYRFNRENNAIARNLAMKAVEISPDYPDAWEWLGWYHFNDYRFAWSADPDRSFKLAKEAANKALVLDASVAGANGMLGALSLYRGDYEAAISHYRKAVELAPSNAIMVAGLAWVLCYGGYPEEAIPLLQQAMRLSPYYPAWMVGTLGLAYMMTGDYQKAIVANEQLIERKSLLQFGYSRLAAIHFTLGNVDRAKTYAAELLKINPDFSIAKWSKVLIYKDNELLEWELNALRLVDLPE